MVSSVIKTNVINPGTMDKKPVDRRFKYPLVNDRSESESELRPFWRGRNISSLEYDRVVNASIKKVYGYLNNADKLALWLSPRATIDTRAGGVFVLSWGQLGKVTGEFVEIEPYQRLSFVWEDDQSLETLVTIELMDRGQRTHLRLRHELFGGATKWEWNEVHLNEWIFFLDNLCSVIESGEDLRPAKAREEGWEWVIGSFYTELETR
jgi:uncharacterized protein YndB with AHSA1/START domain